MRIVVALGGNALLRRGEPMTAERQQANIALAGQHLAPLAQDHELVVAHGNGPQIGLLALEGAAYDPVPPYPLDVLGAETQGMIGYLLQLELTNRLPADRAVATLLTLIEVDPADPAFADPTKPIGPTYRPEEAGRLVAERGWSFRPDGDGGLLRRVVPSPRPQRVCGEAEIERLLGDGVTVVGAGGGGIPVVRERGGHLVGVEAVIDKDHAGGLLARDLAADLYVMATDVDGAFLAHGRPDARRVRAAHPDALLPAHAAAFGAGSMGPKVTAACDFARATGRPAVIGSLADIEDMVAGSAGTRVANDVEGLVLDPS